MKVPARPDAFEPWAMEALDAFARRLAPAPWPQTLAIETTRQSPDPSWLDRIIEERMKS